MKKLILTALIATLVVASFSACKSKKAPEIPQEPAISDEQVENEDADTPENDNEEQTETESETTEGLELTLEELEEYNGTNGKPAYIAIEGIIYDVTDVPEWTEGKHNGYESGHDLTTDMRDKSPHGLSKLEGLKEVGKIVS